VRLALSGEAVELVVSDDGSGFDAAAATTGFGLVGMRERVTLVRGEFDVESDPRTGTTLRVQLPIDA
jgi:signal transduction histidine kinase